MQARDSESLEWRRPSLCPSGGACIEIAAVSDGGMAVRDGKNPHGPVLRFGAAEWAAFVAAVKAGEFDPRD